MAEPHQLQGSALSLSGDNDVTATHTCLRDPFLDVKRFSPSARDSSELMDSDNDLSPGALPVLDHREYR